jgi:cytoskeleton protein RodZ
MSEAADTTARPSAGRLLREARERQGLHIAALAAAIKVTPHKLEMLEADRFDALPDATFTRALAQTVCRALKIDPAGVLVLLPPASAGHRLEQVGGGLNAPFRERPGVAGQRDAQGPRLGAVFWITALILAAALALYFAPLHLFSLAGWGVGAARPATTRTVAPPAIGTRATAGAATDDGPAAAASAALALPHNAAPGALEPTREQEPTPPGAETIPREEATAPPAPAASR